MQSAVTALIVLAACGASPPITDTTKLHEADHVSVRGIAGNAKLGGVIQLGADPVYCGGVAAFPDAVAGTVITATGALVRSLAYVASRDPSTLTQGTAGGVWLLKNCQYTR